MRVRQVPGLPPARIARAGDKLTFGQRGVHVGEGGDLAGRDSAGDMDRLEFPGMIEAGGGGHFGQLVQGLRLLEDDALGGGGSRGSGRIRFANLKLTWRSKAYYASGAPEKELVAGSDLAGLQAKVVEAGDTFIQE